MVSGAETPSRLQAVAYHDLRGERETHARIAERRIVDQELVRAVVGVEVVRQIAQVAHQRVRCAVHGGVLDGLRVTRRCA